MPVTLEQPCGLFETRRKHAKRWNWEDFPKLGHLDSLSVHICIYIYYIYMSTYIYTYVLIFIWVLTRSPFNHPPKKTGRPPWPSWAPIRWISWSRCDLARGFWWYSAGGLDMFWPSESNQENLWLYWKEPPSFWSFFFFFGSETIHLLQGLIDMEWFQIPVNGYKLGFRS